MYKQKYKPDKPDKPIYDEQPLLHLNQTIQIFMFVKVHHQSDYTSLPFKIDWAVDILTKYYTWTQCCFTVGPALAITTSCGRVKKQTLLVNIY